MTFPKTQNMAHHCSMDNASYRRNQPRGLFRENHGSFQFIVFEESTKKIAVYFFSDRLNVMSVALFSALKEFFL